MIAWEDLTSEQQDRLRGLTLVLQEFVYGFDQARQSKKNSVAERLYSNSLYQYFCNIFIAGRSTSTRSFLEAIGSHDFN